MRRLVKVSLVAGLLGVTAVLLLWYFLPGLVQRLPGRVQGRLPQVVLAAGSAPLPTALPAPDISQRRTAVPFIPTLKPTATQTITLSPPPVETVETAVATLPPADTATALPTATPLPAAVRLEGLTITPQKFNNCGPTNLSLVLAYFGHEADQFEIAASVRPTYEDRNVSPEELRDYVNEQTSLQAALVPHGDMGLLKQLVSADYPVIIEKGLLPNEREGWMGHYLTIFGYDDAAQTVVGMDTFLGPWDGSGRLESYATLAEFWRQFNNVLLVVYPPDQEAAITAILGEAHSDPLLTWQRSAETAQTAVTIDATDAFAWFNLGRSLTHLGQLTGEPVYYENGAAAFDQARTLGLPWRLLWYQFDMYEGYLANGRYQDVLALTQAILESGGGQFVAETYLYRGHALRAVGDDARAQAAYEKVLALQPNGAAAVEAASFLNK